MNGKSVAVAIVLACSPAAAFAAPPAPAAAVTAPAAAPEPAAVAAPAAEPAAPLPPMPRHKPDPRDEAYSPNAPIVVSGNSSPAVAMTTASTTMKAFPKAKPSTAMASGPFPRAKPMSSTTVALAAAPAAPAPPAAPPAAPVAATPAAPAIATAPTAPAPVTTPASAPASGTTGTCGDACNEVIFRSIGNCLYVQNANPHSVTFVAKTSTRTITLSLAGADAGKADAHKPFETKEGTP